MPQCTQAAAFMGKSMPEEELCKPVERAAACRLQTPPSCFDTGYSIEQTIFESTPACCRFVRKGSKSKDCGDGHEMWILYPMARLWCSSFSLVSSSTSSKPPKNILPGFRRSTAAVSWRLLLQHLPMFHLSWSLKPWRIAHPV